MTGVPTPSSALRAPSPTRGEGDVAPSRTNDISTRSAGSVGPSPLMGEGGRSPDEGGVKSTKRARALRRNRTEAEARLWSLLRSRRLVGYKFRRQVPIGRAIVDFVCFDARLVIELDGSQHLASMRDRMRDAELSARGFEVLRVWNSELSDNRDGVLEGVLAACVRRGAAPSSALRAPSPTRGEGDVAPSRTPGTSERSAVGPSPVMGEGGRSPDEGGAERPGPEARA